jgi:hypothetical protein
VRKRRSGLTGYQDFLDWHQLWLGSHSSRSTQKAPSTARTMTDGSVSQHAGDALDWLGKRRSRKSTSGKRVLLRGRTLRVLPLSNVARVRLPLSWIGFVHELRPLPSTSIHNLLAAAPTSSYVFACTSSSFDPLSSISFSSIPSFRDAEDYTTSCRTFRPRLQSFPGRPFESTNTTQLSDHIAGTATATRLCL